MDRTSLLGSFDIDGRVAIVTGGSRGIGRSIAHGFAAVGAKVVVASRKADACEKVAAEIAEVGGDALAVPTHMGDLDAIDNLVASTVDHYGRLDIVVNNAANALTQQLGEFTPEAWDKSFAVNLRGPVFLVQGALPHLERSGHGAVVNVLTAGVWTTGRGVAMYTAAKTAMLAFTRSMAADYADRGVRVNALAPGTVDTDMVRANPPDRQESMKLASPMKRMADPDELVPAALYLASDASGFVTGQCLRVDGGMTIAT